MALVLAAPSSSAPDGDGDPPPLLYSVAASPAKKFSPAPWTPQETADLIDAYQERWYALKRGPLKADQWEEVATALAARSFCDGASKTATQCRHKIEKLRNRYRAELRRSAPSLWEFFHHMDQLERGPFPISARPMSEEKPRPRDRSLTRGYEGVSVSPRNNRSRPRSINYVVSENRRSCNLRNPMFRKPRKMFERVEPEEGDEGNDEEREEGLGMGAISELAAAIRKFADGFVRMENKKMEMARETERDRMEMENKRAGMILESQRRIVDTISSTIVGSPKKLKMAQNL